MKDVIEMSGRLLVFDKVDKCGRLFSKDCEITTIKTVPVIQNFDTTSLNNVIGSADITPDEKGLVCNVRLTNFDPDVLHAEFKDQLYIGGFYTQVKSHKENDITVIDGCLLRYIGTTLYPADDECKMVIKEDEKITCNPGCLCVACIHSNPKLNKNFNDTVICHQKNSKCVKIEKENSDG